MKTCREAKVVRHSRQRLDQLSLLGHGEPRVQGRLEASGHFDGTIQDAFPVVGQVQGARSAVGRVQTPLDQMELLEMVDERHHAAGGDPKEVAHRVLWRALHGFDGSEDGEMTGLESYPSHQPSEAARRLESEL